MRARPRLYFIRHGETDWNAEGRLQGQHDIPINEKGRVQAGEAGRRLAALRPDLGALPWLVSPMGRTRETAELGRGAVGLDPAGYTVDERLKEISFGLWEGYTWKEVRKAEPAMARLREQDKWNFVPPDGESYGMLMERVRPWLDSLTEETVAVSHGGVARAVMRLVTGMSAAEAASADIWQGKVLVFEAGAYRWV
ncbi:histidine phosphatase family protein [uncultured Alsobacter sp.]|uniref:histidine phosphatase family protein n=1 Tax=uncultured Alsobacter sp. TaxID=1748258 RepID=UPI0025F94AFF|nr:histidine phosphatase family protein [uncultured Alsobacter sp.]